MSEPLSWCGGAVAGLVAGARGLDLVSSTPFGRPFPASYTQQNTAQLTW